jgi:hypothetical protein
MPPFVAFETNNPAFANSIWQPKACTDNAGPRIWLRRLLIHRLFSLGLKI